MEVDIVDNHEVDALLTKLWKYGFVKEARYIWGVDQWNRPKCVKASFLVYVKRDSRQPFRAMVAQENNHTGSRMSATMISDLL